MTKETDKVLIEKLDKLINLLEPIITNQGLKISGQGMIANNTEETNKILNRINNTLMHMENKLESLMDNEAQERHEQIKRRFSKS